jgi:hypothetical protein
MRTRDEYNIDLQEIVQAMADRKIYGTGFIQIMQNGSLKRICPTKVNLTSDK